MSRSAELELFFGEGTFTFALKIEQLIQLEENRSRVVGQMGLPWGEASIGRILDRLGSGQLLIAEVKEVHRLGLVGGGMDKPFAAMLVDRHVLPGSLMEAGVRAYSILAAAWVGVPEDSPGKKKGGAKPPKASPSPTAAPAGAKSSAEVRPLATPRRSPKA